MCGPFTPFSTLNFDSLLSDRLFFSLNYHTPICSLLVCSRQDSCCQLDRSKTRSLSAELFVVSQPESPLGLVFKMLLDCFSTAMFRGSRGKEKKEVKESEAVNSNLGTSVDNSLHSDSTVEKSEKMIDAARKVNTDLHGQKFRIVSCTEKWIIKLLTTTSVLLGILQGREDGELLMKEIKRKVLIFLNEIWPILFPSRSALVEGSRNVEDEEGIERSNYRYGKKDKLTAADECITSDNPHRAKREETNAIYDFSGLRDYARAAWIECHGGSFPLTSAESIITSSPATLLPPSIISAIKPAVPLLTSSPLDRVRTIGSISESRPDIVFSKMGGDESKKRTFLNISGKTQRKSHSNDNIDTDFPSAKLQNNSSIKGSDGTKELLIVGMDDSLQLKLELGGKRARQSRVPLTGTGADRANMNTQSQQMEEEEEEKEQEKEAQEEEEEVEEEKGEEYKVNKKEELVNKDTSEKSAREARVLTKGREVEEEGRLTVGGGQMSGEEREEILKTEEIRDEVQDRCRDFNENLLHVESREEGKMGSSGEKVGEEKEEGDEETEIVEDGAGHEVQHKDTRKAMVANEILKIFCGKTEEEDQGPRGADEETVRKCADYPRNVDSNVIKPEEKSICSVAEQLLQTVGVVTAANNRMRTEDASDDGAARAVRNQITNTSLSPTPPFLVPPLHPAPVLHNSSATGIHNSNGNDTRLPPATLSLPTIPEAAESPINNSPRLPQVSSLPVPCRPSSILSASLQPCSNANHSVEHEIHGFHGVVGGAAPAPIATSSQYQDFEFIIAPSNPDPGPGPIFSSLSTIPTTLCGMENHTRKEHIGSSGMINDNKQQENTEEIEGKGVGKGHQEVPQSAEYFEHCAERGELENIEKEAGKLKNKRKILDLDLFTSDDRVDQLNGEQSTQLRAEELSSQIIFFPYRGSIPFPSSSSKNTPENRSLIPRTILQSNSKAGCKSIRPVADACGENFSPSLARSMGAMLNSYINSTDTVARTLQDVLDGDGDLSSMSKKICTERDRIACLGSLEASDFHGRSISRSGDLGQEEEDRGRTVCVSISSPQTLIREALEANHRMSGRLLELSRRYQEDL